jgi:hypothetical protein
MFGPGQIKIIGSHRRVLVIYTYTVVKPGEHKMIRGHRRVFLHMQKEYWGWTVSA